MFKLLKKLPDLPGVVSFRVQESPGAFAEHSAMLLFKQLPEQDHVALIDRIKAGDIYDIDIARQAVVGWVDVVDDDGQQVEFSPDVLEQLLGIPGVASAAVRQYFELRNGGPEKNSPSSGDTSPERNAQ